MRLPYNRSLTVYSLELPSFCCGFLDQHTNLLLAWWARKETLFHYYFHFVSIFVEGKKPQPNNKPTKNPTDTEQHEEPSEWVTGPHRGRFTSEEEGIFISHQINNLKQMQEG